MRRLATHKPGNPTVNPPKATDLYDITDQFLSKPMDVERLVAALKEAEHQHEFTKKAFGGWGSIPLRSLHGMTGREASGASGEHASSNAQLFQDTVVMPDYIKELIDEIAGDAGVLKVRLMRLEKNRTIGEHKDRFNPGPPVARMHIPIVTNPQVEFQVNRQSYHLQAGHLYCIDVSQTHAVFNKGDADRIHLVFDVCITPTVSKKLKAAAEKKNGN